MHTYTITSANEAQHTQLAAIWESSVRATHHFLSPEDIEFYKHIVQTEAFKTITLHCIKDNNDNIIGFSGIHGNNLEMLFVHANYIGKGAGKALLEHAIKTLGITKVDVNEDNKEAHQFYERNGFRIIGRSPLDESGKAYPILHMGL